MKHLTEWCLIDDDQIMRFDIPKLLEAMNVADTPENRDVCFQTIADLMHKEFPNLTIDGDSVVTGRVRLYPKN